MNYTLIKELMELAETFDKALNTFPENRYSNDVKGFKKWIGDSQKTASVNGNEPQWEGKENGRTPESVINTLIVHLNRYAKSYSKSAMHGSGFSTQEDFIYLINLKTFGAMTKIELIKRNIHEKPVGMQIISRLINQDWAKQSNSDTDRRSKMIEITNSGLLALERQMDKIRQATQIVTGDLNYNEKMELITLLNKLDRFHHPIFSKRIETSVLLDTVANEYLSLKN